MLTSMIQVKARAQAENKQEQLHGGTVRVEANLPGTSAVIAKFLMQMRNKKMFDLENESHYDGATTAMAPFDDGKYRYL